MERLALSIRTDFDAVSPDLIELSDRLQAAPHPCREAVDRVFNVPQSLVEVSGVGADDPSAPGAGVFHLRAKLTDEARSLLAALRTGDFDAWIAERTSDHFSTPVGDDTSTVGAPAGRVSPSQPTPGGDVQGAC